MRDTWSSRDAVPSDHPHFVRFFAELEVPDPVADAATWEREFAPHTIFLEHDGAPVAYGVTHPFGDEGYVVHVVVDRAHRGRGVGVALMGALAGRLRAAGCSRWSLNVRANNAPALRLYARCGLHVAYASTAMKIPWACVPRLPRDDRAVTSRLIEPREDADLEAAFDLQSGRLAAMRARSGRVLLRLVDVAAPEEAKVGLAVFAPDFPGSFPFRVARPGLAAALLEAKRAYARPEHDHVRMMVEDDAELRKVLGEAGGEVVEEMLQMRGSLPGLTAPLGSPRSPLPS